MTAALAIERLTVRYEGCPAVLDVSLRVEPGEWLCLIGPNGAGKSSLLRAVLGLERFEGTVAIDGAPLASLPARRRAQLIAYVPQEPLLPDGMTAHEYVLLGRNPYVSRFGAESAHDHRIASDVLDRLDLTVFARRPLGSLSGGERQRLVIARAVAQQAPVLLLDEPTSALDIGHQQQALELIDQLRRERGLTVISAMHDLTLAGLYSDRLALLHQGSVAACGAARDVLQAEIIERHYGVSIRILHEPDGTVVVVPSRKATS